VIFGIHQMSKNVFLNILTMRKQIVLENILHLKNGSLDIFNLMKIIILSDVRRLIV
jgi:hypothetical protein